MQVSFGDEVAFLHVVQGGNAAFQFDFGGRNTLVDVDVFRAQPFFTDADVADHTVDAIWA